MDVPKDNPKKDIKKNKSEDKKSSEQEDIVAENNVDIEKDSKKKQELKEEQEAQEAQEARSKACELTDEEKRFLKERVLGRENAVDGHGSKIHLANGKSIVNSSIVVNNEAKEFVGYKSRFRRMDKETALAIVLIAKDKEWDKIDVHGSKRSKKMLAEIAIEHGLKVGNYNVPTVNSPKQDVPKQSASKQDVPKQSVSKQDVPKQDVSKQDVSKQMVNVKDNKISSFSKEPIKVISNFGRIGMDNKKPALPAPSGNTLELPAPENKKLGLPNPKIKAPALPPPSQTKKALSLA